MAYIQKPYGDEQDWDITNPHNIEQELLATVTVVDAYLNSRYTVTSHELMGALENMHLMLDLILKRYAENGNSLSPYGNLPSSEG